MVIPIKLSLLPNIIRRITNRISVNVCASGVIFLGGVLFVVSGFSASNPSSLPKLTRAHNLALSAQIAQQNKQALIVMVSLHDCPFCERVRRDNLWPLAQSGAHIVQVDLDNTTALLDFDGKPTTHQAFARALGVKIAPAVFFFNAAGEQLAAPLLGASIPDFYEAYLQQALQEVQKNLRPNQ